MTDLTKDELRALVESDPADDGELRPEGPRKLGFSVKKMNKQFALVLLGSKAVIFREKPDAPLDDQQRILALEAFHAWFSNRFTEIVDASGKIKAISWAAAWLRDRQRRSFEGVEFYPDPANAVGTPGYLNLWSGFSVVPNAGAGSYAIFRDHLLNNVCRGDAQLFNWVFAFFAQMVQRPRERIGVALVMRGAMGSGKSKVGEVFGSLIQRHYFMVDDPRYVTGQFNAHMATCLLLQADEAVWAGDKAAEGRLKGLITSPFQQIEAKGVDPIRLRNFVRLIMTSNEDWVVPAGKDERRFCVLDIDPRCAQNHEYFREMDAQLKAGGREALLADLLAFDLANANLRQIPRTEALLEQKIRSLDSVESWFFERLRAGSSTRDRDTWSLVMPRATMIDDYVLASDRVGVKRKAAETEVGMKLRKLVPALGEVRATVDVPNRDGHLQQKRAWCWRFPPLAECRAAFELAMQQRIAWPADDDAGFARAREAEFEGVE